MAEQQGNALAALFPGPPTFYEQFTSDNLAQIEELREAQQSQSTESTVRTDSKSSVSYELPVRLFDLPPELRFLQPPEPPEEGKSYRTFGDIYNLSESLPSLAEQNIKQLYTPPPSPSPGQTNTPIHHDRALTLKRLSKSLLLNFLELMGIMSVTPAAYADKIGDLRTLFINFHHLLNEYRPHQARESLIRMMEGQLERVKAETEGVKALRSRVEEVLGGLGSDIQAGVSRVSGGQEDMSEEQEKRLEEAQEDQIWAELAEDFA